MKEQKINRNTHIKYLTRLIREVVGDTPRLGCEVGVWEGRNSQHLLNWFPELYLIMVDCWRKSLPENEGGPRKLVTQDGMHKAMIKALNNTDRNHRRRIVLIGDSIQVLHLVQDNSLDIVFIDPLHSYKGTKRDMAWYRKVRSGGLFCGHDYDSKRDRSGVYGVKPAVDEFAAENGYEVNVAIGRIWWFKKR